MSYLPNNPQAEKIAARYSLEGFLLAQVGYGAVFLLSVFCLNQLRHRNTLSNQRRFIFVLFVLSVFCCATVAAIAAASAAQNQHNDYCVAHGQPISIGSSFSIGTATSIAGEVAFIVGTWFTDAMMVSVLNMPGFGVEFERDLSGVSDDHHLPHVYACVAHLFALCPLVLWVFRWVKMFLLLPTC
jgi:hypothetical protein